MYLLLIGCAYGTYDRKTELPHIPGLYRCISSMAAFAAAVATLILKLIRKMNQDHFYASFCPAIC